MTERFIAMNPVEVEIKRATKVPNGTGGWTQTTPVDVEMAIARRVARGYVGESSERVSDQGQTVIPQWIFIFMPDVDLQVGDTFDFSGYLCEVLTLSNSPPWRLQAEVYQHAKQ